MLRTAAGDLHQPHTAAWKEVGCSTCELRLEPIGPSDSHLCRMFQGQVPATAVLVAAILLRSTREGRLAGTRLLIHLLGDRE